MTDLCDQSILIVEDLTTDARLIARAMKKARISNPLVFLSDGQQVVDYLSGTGEHPDRDRHGMPILMLLDLKLPKRNGFEVLEWLRQREGLKRLPVVVLTSSSRSPDVNRAYDLGANSYLVKPVEDSSLVEMFRSLDVYWLVVNTPPEISGKS